MSANLQVLLDIETAPAARANKLVGEWHAVSAGWGQSRSEYVVYEPNSGLATIRPYQLYADSHTIAETYMPRFGLSEWVGATEGAWEEVQRDNDRWLLSKSIDDRLETSASIDADTGLCVDFYVYGAEHDLYNVFKILFGGWTVSVWSDGQVNVTDPDNGELRTGWLTPSRTATLVGRTTRMLIIPIAMPGLMILTADGGGFLYKLLPGRTGENIVAAGSVVFLSLGHQQFIQISEVRYPTNVDPWLLLPQRSLVTPPATGQVAHIRPVWYNLGGGTIAQLFKPLSPSGGYDDLTPFEPNGIDKDYCLGFLLMPNAGGTKAPWVAGANVNIDDAEVEQAAASGDITQDVLSCSLSVGERGLDTEAHIEIRNPDDWEIEGICGCQAQLWLGDRLVLDGVLAEPARVRRQTGSYARAELKVRSIAGKMADLPCLPASLVFDGLEHGAVVQWLLRYLGLPTRCISIEGSDATLPVTASKPDYSDSRLRTQTADTVADWISRIEELTGWRLLDGPLTITSGDPPEEQIIYGYRWLDPLNLSDVPVHTFVVDTASSAGPDAYDLVRSEINAYSIEPEGNEIHVICGGVDGALVDAVYIDQDAQNPELPPDQRPPGWLGYRKLVTIVLDLVLPDSVISELALRMGQQLSLRCDMVEFTGDWPGTVWVGDAIALDMGSSGLPYGGTYRIESMDVDWQAESVAYPVRRASYRCVKLDEQLATRARRSADERLAQTMSYYMRYGPRREVQAVGGALAPPRPGEMGYMAPPSRTIWVNEPQEP